MCGLFVASHACPFFASHEYIITVHHKGVFICISAVLHHFTWVNSYITSNGFMYVGSLGFIHISDHICLFICCIHTTHPSMDQYIASHVILTFIYPMYAFMRCTKSVNLYIASSLQPPMEGPAEVQLRPAHTIHQLEGFVLIIFSKNLQEHL